MANLKCETRRTFEEQDSRVVLDQLLRRPTRNSAILLSFDSFQ